MHLGRGTQLTHHNSSLLQNDIASTSTSFSNLSLFLFVLVAPHGLWGLSSPTKNGTQVLSSGSRVLTREFSHLAFAECQRATEIEMNSLLTILYNAKFPSS